MTQQPYGYAPPPPNHPQAITVLVLGIVGLVVCQVLSPFAWSMGNKALREIDASRGQIGGRSEANIGRILGIIGTVILGVSLLLVVGMLVVMFVGAGMSVST